MLSHLQKLNCRMRFNLATESVIYMRFMKRPHFFPFGVDTSRCVEHTWCLRNASTASYVAALTMRCFR